MAEEKQSLTSLFHRLCQLAFLHEAELREDAYTRIRYTRCRRRKLQTRLYEKLFDELKAPWVGANRNNKRDKLANKTGLDVYEKLAVTVFKLRLCRQFDKADWLEYNCLKWKSLPGSLKNAVDPSEPVHNITDPDAVLRFIVALSGTGPQQSSPLLGYQNEFHSTNLQHKGLKSVLPEGPLLSTDSYKLQSEALLADQYILYSSDLFERPPTIEDTPNVCKGYPLFRDIMAPGQGRNRFFAVQEAGEVLHDKRTRLTVFGALSHGYTDDMQVKLGLPELPSYSEKTLGVSSLPSLESPEDEGFHELTDPSNGTPQYSTRTGCTDIWTEALKLSPQKFYTWEMEGRRDGVTDCPYITEAGPIVFDELYNLVCRQVSYLVKTPTLYRMVSLETLIDHSLNVLIGVPTTTFLTDRESLEFHVNPDIRLSGCSPESLHNTLSKLSSIGTDYVQLVQFINHKALCGGLVLHAFIGGLRNYLQCYRAAVLSIDLSSVQSPFQLTFTFQSLEKQLRFLSDMCMCSTNPKRPHSKNKTAFPVGVKLLSYLYKLCLEHSSSDYYPVLLSLLKHSCAPYIMFIQQWVFQGICRDIYEEFIIEVDDQFLAYRDKHFWSHGFVISEKDKLDCVPMFLSELANDIFVCGKSINLMKLCYPFHFLCDSGVPPPKMEVTFSMDKLKAIDQNCLDYVQAIEGLAKSIKDKRDRERLVLEEAKEKALVEERTRAEKALAEVTGLIQQVKEAIDTKKKADLKMLKEQMEEAIKNRQLDKERADEVDSEYMVDALNRAAADEQLREQARQELIDYYQKLTEEMDRREERAQWKIKRLKLNETRVQFFVEEQAKLERLKTEASEVHDREKEGRGSAEKKTEVGVAGSSSQASEHLSVSVSGHPDPSSSSQAIDHQSPSVSSPSLVSLIASGVKTDALVKLAANKSLNSSSASDSGFIPGTTTVTGFPGKYTKDGDGDLSEDHTLHSVLSLGHDEQDGDETDISVASNVSVPSGRKKWSNSKETMPDLKSEPSSTTSRRTWDPADGDVHLAESPFPQSHPSDSSVQFSMYGDKKLDTPKADEIKGTSRHPSPLQLGTTPNPSDSSVQGLLYPVSVERNSHGDVTEGEGVTFTQEKPKSKGLIGEETRPTEETVESKGLIGRTVSSDANGLRSNGSADNTQSEEQSKQDLVIQDFMRSLSKGVDEIRTPSLGHPSDSNMRSYMSEGHTTDGLRIMKTISVYGHPNQSSAQSSLYPTQDPPTDLPGQTKSSFGHPNDSTAQNMLYGSEETSIAHATLRTYPSVLGPSTDLPGQTKSSFGHPNDSTAQNMLYGSEETSIARATPRTHPSVLTDKTPTPSGHRSVFGHPSDSQISSTVSNQNILAYKSRSHWGHPSDSKVQKLLGDISTLSKSQRSTGDVIPTPNSLPISLVQDQVLSENTRGTPPVDSAKDIIYPVGGSVSPWGTYKSTRGHEPAVKIAKLMYPAEQEQEMAPEPLQPLQFEDVWVASEVQSLQVKFNVLDEQPTTDLLKSALTAVPIDRDDDEDIEAAQLMTLPVLLRRSVTAPLMAQISLVNSAVVEYFMEDLNLPKHFEVFRKFLFMEDGEFSLSLSDQLFEKLTTGVSPQELCSPTLMNGIVTRALQLSVYADKTGFEQQLSFALKALPDMFNLNDIGTLDFLELRYRVQWPLNIIITENSIIKYNKVFSFMLRLKRVAWVLREVWFHLKHIGFSRRAAGSPQLRQLQLFRHEMLHFLQNMDGYLSNQILNVTWVEFQQELATNVCDLDDLHHRHTEYLNKAVFRSLLSKKASPVMKIITDMFSLVLKFRTQLLSCPWQQDSDVGHVTHPRFDVMCSTHKAFKEYSGFLFTVLSKLVRRGYQSHLQDFLLRLNFNDFYKT